MPPPPRQTLSLWPTTMGVYRWDQAEAANPLLMRVFGALRATQSAQRGAAASAAPFFASDDDLLHRVQLPEWQALVRFIVDGVRDTAAAANAEAWSARGGSPALQLALEGIWFQFSNRGAHHDIHTHGNCSWSGVYCVAVDDEAVRTAHPVFGALNGVTRFYGPHFQSLGGAHVDFGNAYLQQPHIDIAPRPGQLIVFPSWLPHQALPYEGRDDRLIVSFNASVHAAEGGNRMHAYARG